METALAHEQGEILLAIAIRLSFDKKKRSVNRVVIVLWLCTPYPPLQVASSVPMRREIYK